MHSSPSPSISLQEPQLSYIYQEREEKEPDNFLLFKLGKLSFQAS